MANQKMWTRNYDNFFSGICGCVGNGPAHEGSAPNEARPYFRNLTGGYMAGSFNNWSGLGNSTGIALHRPSSYVTGTGFTFQYTTVSYSQLDSFIQPYWGICLGSGTDAPSYEDYELKVPIRSNMTIGTITQIANTYDATNHTYTYGYKVPIAYSGANDITINEFGLYAPVFNSSPSKSYLWNANATLVYHEVFEEGITLHQNDTIELTITQTVTQPNYHPYPTE